MGLEDLLKPESPKDWANRVIREAMKRHNKKSCELAKKSIVAQKKMSPKLQRKVLQVSAN